MKKKIEKFCRIKNNAYLCNPVTKTSFQNELKDNIADVAQLARARDL